MFMYSIDITLGAQTVTLLVDTGSGDTWIIDPYSFISSRHQTPCGSSYVYASDDLRNGALRRLGQLNVSYVDERKATGQRVNARLAAISNGIFDGNHQNLQLNAQTLGLADESNQCIGILGVGYTDNLEEPVAGRSLLRNLYGSEAIESESYSLFPTYPSGGSILFGAVDGAKIDG